MTTSTPVPFTFPRPASLAPGATFGKMQELPQHQPPIGVAALRERFENFKNQKFFVQPRPASVSGDVSKYYNRDRNQIQNATTRSRPSSITRQSQNRDFFLPSSKKTGSVLEEERQKNAASPSRNLNEKANTNDDLNDQHGTVLDKRASQHAWSPAVAARERPTTRGRRMSQHHDEIKHSIVVHDAQDEQGLVSARPQSFRESARDQIQGRDRSSSSSLFHHAGTPLPAVKSAALRSSTVDAATTNVRFISSTASEQHDQQTRGPPRRGIPPGHEVQQVQRDDTRRTMQSNASSRQFFSAKSTSSALGSLLNEDKKSYKDTRSTSSAMMNNKGALMMDLNLNNLKVMDPDASPSPSGSSKNPLSSSFRGRTNVSTGSLLFQSTRSCSSSTNRPRSSSRLGSRDPRMLLQQNRTSYSASPVRVVNHKNIAVLNEEEKNRKNQVSTSIAGFLAVEMNGTTTISAGGRSGGPSTYATTIGPGRVLSTSTMFVGGGGSISNCKNTANYTRDSNSALSVYSVSPSISMSPIPGTRLLVTSAGLAAKAQADLLREKSEAGSAKIGRPAAEDLDPWKIFDEGRDGKILNTVSASKQWKLNASNINMIQEDHDRSPAPSKGESVVTANEAEMDCAKKPPIELEVEPVTPPEIKEEKDFDVGATTVQPEQLQAKLQSGHNTATGDFSHRSSPIKGNDTDAKNQVVPASRSRSRGSVLSEKIPPLSLSPSPAPRNNKATFQDERSLQLSVTTSSSQLLPHIVAGQEQHHLQQVRRPASASPAPQPPSPALAQFLEGRKVNEHHFTPIEEKIKQDHDTDVGVGAEVADRIMSGLALPVGAKPEDPGLFNNINMVMLPTCVNNSTLEQAAATTSQQLFQDYMYRPLPQDYMYRPLPDRSSTASIFHTTGSGFLDDKSGLVTTPGPAAHSPSASFLRTSSRDGRDLDEMHKNIITATAHQSFYKNRVRSTERLALLKSHKAELPAPPSRYSSNWRVSTESGRLEQVSEWRREFLPDLRDSAFDAHSPLLGRSGGEGSATHGRETVVQRGRSRQRMNISALRFATDRSEIGNKQSGNNFHAATFPIAAPSGSSALSSAAATFEVVGDRGGTGTGSAAVATQDACSAIVDGRPLLGVHHEQGVVGNANDEEIFGGEIFDAGEDHARIVDTDQSAGPVFHARNVLGIPGQKFNVPVLPDVVSQIFPLERWGDFTLPTGIAHTGSAGVKIHGQLSASVDSLGLSRDHVVAQQLQGSRRTVEVEQEMENINQSAHDVEVNANDPQLSTKTNYFGLRHQHQRNTSPSTSLGAAALTYAKIDVSADGREFLFTNNSRTLVKPKSRPLDTLPVTLDPHVRTQRRLEVRRTRGRQPDRSVSPGGGSPSAASRSPSVQIAGGLRGFFY
ncbi:unnamed protein product [Amoebophrya sp. A120]|nr:unnamed protein product [Amoebophrya sp. A120]|eukprot:GSA120T00007869001.1